jgi:hypothetical protein
MGLAARPQGQIIGFELIDFTYAYKPMCTYLPLEERCPEYDHGKLKPYITGFAESQWSFPLHTRGDPLIVLRCRALEHIFLRRLSKIFGGYVRHEHEVTPFGRVKKKVERSGRKTGHAVWTLENPVRILDFLYYMNGHIRLLSQHTHYTRVVQHYQKESVRRRLEERFGTTDTEHSPHSLLHRFLYMTVRPLRTSQPYSLNNDAWFSGFLDGRGTFTMVVRPSPTRKTYHESLQKQVKSTFALSLLSESPPGVQGDAQVALDIARLLGTSLKTSLTEPVDVRMKTGMYRKDQQTLRIGIETRGFSSHERLIHYLKKFPLFTSKRFDCLDFREIHRVRARRDKKQWNHYPDFAHIMQRVTYAHNVYRSEVPSWKHLKTFYAQPRRFRKKGESDIAVSRQNP